MKLKHNYFTLLLSLFLFLSFDTFCQKSGIVVQYHQVDSTSLLHLDEYNLKNSFATQATCLQYLKEIPTELGLKGFIASSVDSVGGHGDTVVAWIYLGQKWSWSQIRVRSNFEDFNRLKETNIYQLEAGKQLGTSIISDFKETFIDYCLDNGYPFASAQLDSIEMKDGKISGMLVLDKKQFYRIDSIAIVGKTKVSQNFIYQYLGISAHEPYSTSKLQKIDKLMRELTFVELDQPWTVTMTNAGAVITLYLKQKQSSQIDAIVGFLPANGDQGGKLLVTGQVNIDLKNTFGGGESLGLNWQQLQSRSPRLNINFSKPYMFHSPYGLNLDFELYKKDSAYLNVRANTGIVYNISSRQYGTVYLQFASTRLLDVDTLSIISSHTLPDNLDVGSTSIGFTYHNNTTDYLFNPRRGMELAVNILGGQKNVSKNTTITSIMDTFDYNKLYDTVKLKSYQFRSSIAVSQYFPIGRQATFKSGLNAGTFYSPKIYTNEMFQIGGRKLLRGFSEESIFANNYVVLSEEYRYLIGQNAYFFAFTDGGWAQYHTSLSKFSHTYIGLGGGIAFQTKNGILNVSYAVGKRDDSKLDMQQAKIHIGFTSFF